MTMTMTTFRVKFKRTKTITLEVLASVAGRLGAAQTAVNYTEACGLYMDCDVDTNAGAWLAAGWNVETERYAQRAATLLAGISEIMQIVEL